MAIGLASCEAPPEPVPLPHIELTGEFDLCDRSTGILTGDGDGIPEPGETIGLDFVLFNSGDTISTDLRLEILSSAPAGVTLVRPVATYVPIDRDCYASHAGGWDIYLNHSAADADGAAEGSMALALPSLLPLDVAELSLTISISEVGASGQTIRSWQSEITVPISVKPGMIATEIDDDFSPELLLDLSFEANSGALLAGVERPSCEDAVWRFDAEPVAPTTTGDIRLAPADLETGIHRISFTGMVDGRAVSAWVEIGVASGSISVRKRSDAVPRRLAFDFEGATLPAAFSVTNDNGGSGALAADPWESDRSYAFYGNNYRNAFNSLSLQGTVPLGLRLASISYRYSLSCYYLAYFRACGNYHSGGSESWSQRTVTLDLPGGTAYSYTFSYRAHSQYYAGSDAAWLDDVVLEFEDAE